MRRQKILAVTVLWMFYAVLIVLTVTHDSILGDMLILLLCIILFTFTLLAIR